MFANVIGLIAMVTSTISLLPQIYRTYQTRSSTDLSLGMLWNLFICSISWVIYGILIDATAIWVTNILMTIFSSTLLILSRRYRVRD